jgi:hypothetical protein
MGSIRTDVKALEGIKGPLSGIANGRPLTIYQSQYEVKQLIVAIPETQIQVLRNPAFRSFLTNMQKASGVIIRVFPTRRWRLK